MADDLMDLYNAPPPAPPAPTPSQVIDNGTAIASKTPDIAPLTASAGKYTGGAGDAAAPGAAGETPAPAAESPTQEAPPLPAGFEHAPPELPTGTPQPQPAAPAPVSPGFAPEAAKPLVPMPSLSPAQQQDLARQAGNRYFQKEGVTPFNPIDAGLLGAARGAATVGAQGKSLLDYLTGHVAQGPDWQAQQEQGIPEDVKGSIPYKAGDILGQTGAYGAAGMAAAAASPIEVPAAATGIGAAALRGLGLAAEGATIGAGGATQEAMAKGKTPKAEDVAGSAGLGALGSAVVFPAAQKAIGAVAKPIARGVTEGIKKLADSVQSELIKAESASIKAAGEALAEGTAPLTSIAKKQVELGQKLRDEIDQEIERLEGIAKGGKGPTRGVRQGRGYQRAYNGVSLESVVKKLPDAIAKPYEAAVHELAEAKVMVENLRKQMQAYAENAIRLAKEPADMARISKEIQAHGDLKTQTADTLAKVRAHLFAEMRRLEGMTHPLANLEISTLKHVHVTADADSLAPKLDPLKKTFVAAAKQAEDAQRKLVNAEEYLRGLREKHLPLFQQVDDHIGLPVTVRVIKGHAATGANEAAVSMGQQFNPSRAHLTGRWQDRYNQIKRGIEAVERNWKEKVTYNVAQRGRVTLPGAEKLLRDAGLIHPAAKQVLLAGALGYLSFQGPPAKAAGMDDSNTPEQNIGAQALLPAAIVGVVLARKYGPAGARSIINSSRFIFHFLWNDTQDLAAMADGIIAKGRGEAIHELDSLANAMNEYRGKLMQKSFVCPDSHDVVARALINKATPEELAAMTPQAHKFVQECHAHRDAFREFVGRVDQGRALSGYVKEFDDYFHALPEVEQTAAKEIRNAVHSVATAFGGSPAQSGGDFLLQKIAARSAAYHFTLNWQIAATAWLHDTAAYGGMQLGVPSVYAAYGQYTSSPLIRGMVQKMHLGGPATEAAQELNPHAKAYTVEAVHNQLAFLGSLNRQYQEMAPEIRAKLGIKSGNDFAEKVMRMALPDEHQARIFEEAALDVSRMTGADPTGLNKLGMERALRLGGMQKYTRYVQIDARLIKQNLQAIVQYASEGKNALALQRAGRLGHAMAVKAQYGGAKALIPIGAYGILMSNPWTAQTTAQVADKIDDMSLGLRTFGDLGEHGRWDLLLIPALGQRAPGFDDAIEGFKDLMTTGASITKMQQVLQSDDPMALFTGSKSDDDVKKGQAALVHLINTAGLIAPKIGGMPTRWVRDAVKALPDALNREFNVSLQGAWNIGRSTIAPKKLVEYAPEQGQTEQEASDQAFADALGEFVGRRPGVRPRKYETAKQVQNAMKSTEAETPEPAEAAALSEK